MLTLPQDVHKGMKVFDNSQNEIGKVDDFRFSENQDFPELAAEVDPGDRQRSDSLLDNIAEAFGGEEIPEILRDRLLSEGYIRLDTKGLFAADRYILPEQIASAVGDQLVLNVSKDDLLKRH
jgi:hypothetical protein